MAARVVDDLPEGDEWIYEVKFDGYRAIAIKQAGQVSLYSRNGKPFNALFPEIVAALNTVRAKAFIIDGELVALDEQGRHSFSLLQSIRKRRAPVHFFLFDLLHVEGKDLLRKPIEQPRRLSICFRVL